VFNEAVLKGIKVREDFPFSRAVEVPLQISMLSPMLKAQWKNRVIPSPMCTQASKGNSYRARF